MLYKCPEPPREWGQEGETYPMAGQVPGNCLETGGRYFPHSQILILAVSGFHFSKKMLTGISGRGLARPAALWQP